MAYVGNTPSRGQWRKLTDISGSFDGVTTTFTTSVPPGTSEYYVTAGTASQLIISLGGVIQEPDVDYSVSTNSITFTTAPAAGLSFFGVLCGDALNTGVPSDGSITTSKLGGNLTVDLASGSAATPSLTFDSNTGLYSPGEDQVAVSTGGTGRLFIDSSGRVGIGTSSPSGTVHAYNAGGLTSVVIGGDAASSYSQVQLRNSSAKYNWSLSAQNNVDNGFEITPSTAAGGSTFSTPAVVVKSDGKVGIGTTSPDAPFKVATSSTSNGVVANFENTSTGALIQYGQPGVANWRAGVVSGADAFAIYGFGSGSYPERLRVDSSGRLLVGTSSTSANSTVVLQGASSDSTAGSIFRMNRGVATPADGAGLGTIVFGDSSSSDGAYISGLRDGGTWSGSSKPTRLAFSTTADGASSPTERMRIDRNGSTSVFVPAGADAINVGSASSAGTANALFWGGHSSTGPGNYGTNCIRINTNGNIVNTNNSYGSLSDLKLKENIVDATSQWDDLKALQVRKYNFKEGQTHTQIGLVAQEVELVSPGLVTESPDRDEEGNDLGTVTKSVNYSVLYMKAVKALQEAMERIEQLEAEMAEVKDQLS